MKYEHIDDFVDEWGKKGDFSNCLINYVFMDKHWHLHIAQERKERFINVIIKSYRPFEEEKTLQKFFETSLQSVINFQRSCNKDNRNEIFNEVQNTVQTVQHST